MLLSMNTFEWKNETLFGFQNPSTLYYFISSLWSNKKLKYCPYLKVYNTETHPGYSPVASGTKAGIQIS